MADTIEPIQADIIEISAPTYPPGEWAIVEIMGHSTMVGRITEIERFGTKMLAIEPLFDGVLLGPIYQGGPSIYRLTPCSAEIAFKEQPTKSWQLPPVVQKIIPVAMLATETSPGSRYSYPADDDDDHASDDDERPF